MVNGRKDGSGTCRCRSAGKAARKGDREGK
jgi:hypothetical protein